MRIEQLNALIYTAETNSMQKAADILFTSIQNISKQIILLEKELNVILFTRTKYGVFLTADGEFVYREAKEILNHVDIIFNKYNSKDSKNDLVLEGNLRILTCLTFKHFVGNCVKRLRTTSPLLNFTCDIEETSTINKKILKSPDIFNEYQAIITGMGQKELHDIKNSMGNYEVFLLSEYYIGIHVNFNHPLTQYFDVPLKTLFSYPLISVQSSSGSHLLEIIAEQGVSLKPSLSTNSTEQCTEFIAEGLGYGLFSMPERKKTIYNEKLKTIILPLREQISISYILLLPPNDQITPQLQVFKDELLRFFSDNYYRII